MLEDVLEGWTRDGEEEEAAWSVSGRDDAEAITAGETGIVAPAS